jgi:hypothetical protein
MPSSNGKGAPKGNRNGESHSVITFRNQVKRRVRKGRSLIDRRTTSGRNAIAVQQEIIADLGGVDQLSAAKLCLVELIARDVYFCDEIDRRIFHTLYAVNQINANNKRYGAKGLATLYSYRQGAARNLASNLALLGLEKAPPPVKSLEEILSEPEESDGAAEGK